MEGASDHDTGGQNPAAAPPAGWENGGAAWASEVEACRSYLMLVAERAVGPDLAAKVGASDLVQDTMLEARQSLGEFRGESPGELRRWLRRILLSRAAFVGRQFRGTEKRRLDRERAIDLGTGLAEATLADPLSTPSGHAIRDEQEAALLAALDQLPEHYRQVIALRHREARSFEEVGAELGVSPEAARKLWTRALQRLRDLLGPGHDPR